MEQNETSLKVDSINLLILLYKKKFLIIIITAIGALASVIASFMITPMFQSTVILYPVSSASVSKTLLTNNERGNLMAFGEEEETEQLLQILESDEISNRIIEKYNLVEHYEIDKNSQYMQTSLYKTYNSNVSARKTPFQSIEIKVMDKDPVIAANIANDISDLVDTVINSIKKKRAFDALLIVEYEYKKLSQQINKLSDSLTVLNSLGVINFRSEVEAYSKGLADGIATGKITPQGIASLEKKMEGLKKYGHIYSELSAFIELEQKQLSAIKAKWVEAGVEYAQNMPHKFVINKARPAEKKSYPVRWLIVVLSSVSTFVFAVFLILGIDTIKKIKAGL